MQVVLTDAGRTKLVEAIATGNPLVVDNYKIGSDAGYVPDGTETAVSTEVYSGGLADLTSQSITPDLARFRVTLNDAVGDFLVGNVGIYLDDGTLFALGVLSAAQNKKATAGNITGNILQLTLDVQFTNIDSGVALSIEVTDLASWPYVETEGDLPVAAFSGFEGYIIRNYNSLDKPALAVRSFINSTWQWFIQELPDEEVGTGPLSISVGPGQDYDTLKEALDYLSTLSLLSDVTVTIADGGTIETGQSIWEHAQGDRVTVQGTLTQTTISGVNSIVDNGAGDHEIEYDVADTTGLTVGRFAAIRGLSGTGNFENHEGCWEILNVDTVNSRVTVKNTYYDATFPAGTTVTGGQFDQFDSPVNLNNAAAGPIVSRSEILFKDIVFTNALGDSLTSDLGSLVVMEGVVGSANPSSDGFVCQRASAMVTGNSTWDLVSSGAGQHGMLVQSGANVAVTGQTVCNGNEIGMRLDDGSSTTSTVNVSACGNNNDGLQMSGGATGYLASLAVCNNGATGCNIIDGCYIDMSSSKVDGNAGDGCSIVDGSTVLLTSSTITNNGGDGVTVLNNAYADCVSVTSSDNGGNGFEAATRGVINAGSCTAENNQRNFRATNQGYIHAPNSITNGTGVIEDYSATLGGRLNIDSYDQTGTPVLFSPLNEFNSSDGLIYDTTMDTAPAEIVDSPITLTVPSEYATVNAALAAISSKIIVANATITIVIEDAVVAHTQTITIDHPQASSILIQGQTPAVKNITGINSIINNGVGDHEIEYDLDDVSGIDIGDYILLDDTTGTGLNRYHHGCWEVLNVDGVNSRITIKHGHREATTPASTLTAGTVKVMKSILDFTGLGSDAISIQRVVLNELSNVVIINGGQNGLTCQEGGGISQLENFGANGFTNSGIQLTGASSISSTSSDVFSNNNNDHGINIVDRSSFITTNAVANQSGVSVNGNGDGVGATTNAGLHMRSGAFADVGYLDTIGNNSHGVFATTGCTINCPNIDASNNISDGMTLTISCTAVIDAATFDNNGSNGLTVFNNSSCTGTTISSSGNIAFGLDIREQSQVGFTTATVNNNGNSGVNLMHNSHLDCTTLTVDSNSVRGMEAQYDSSFLFTDFSASSNTLDGLFVNYASKGHIGNANCDNNGRDGIALDNGSTVTASTGSTASGNTWNGVEVDTGSTFTCRGLIANSNTKGIILYNGSVANVPFSSFNLNTDDNVDVKNSYLDASNVTSTNATNAGFRSRNGSYIEANGSVTNGTNGTDYIASDASNIDVANYNVTGGPTFSPALNVVGNNESLIFN